LPEQGCCDATFLSTTLNQMRTEQPTLLAPLASSVTDARFYRVFVEYFITGIHIKAELPTERTAVGSARTRANFRSPHRGKPSHRMSGNKV
jgi:hypothetical protein